jgi:formylglycine-generating enzyme required for sulfatase activity
VPTRYDFFIAHASADKPAARLLDDHLRAQGSTAFLDERCVTPGTPWDAAIPAALEASSVVVALVSGERPAPGGAHYFRDELAAAIDRHRSGGAPVVPVYLKDQSPPAAVPYGLRILHGLFVEGPGGWDEVVARLLGMVRSEPPKDVVELKRELADLEAEVAREEAGWTPERRAERRALTRKLREAVEPTEVVKAGACFAGRYPIVEKLGQGAFASVWKALDGRRTIALRIMHPHLGPSGRERFFRGGRAMAALDHPSVVRVHEAEGEYQGQAFLTMELLAGGDLTAAQRARRITREDTARIITAVAGALETAHERGLIHRDVKPTNIVLTQDGVPKLTDFDLVHAADSYAGTQAAVGSPCFMAPECDGRAEPTEAADQFGLAMTAVWLLAERDLRIEDWMRPERTLARLGLPEGAVRVLLRALEIDPGERHASIRGFAEALAEALGDVGGRAVVDVRAETGSLGVDRSADASPVESPPGLVMVPIPGGTFMMGSPAGVGRDDERPQRQITLSPFLMSATTITQAQYQAVTCTQPSQFKGDHHPVDSVSWEDAVDFCNALSRQEGWAPAYDDTRRLVPGADGYRLPTEAEWEYACRAGSPGLWCFGDDARKLSEYAWFGSGEGGTHPVGQKKPNAWGLFDMHGNVWEWCEDVCHAHPGASVAEADERLLRGGSAWYAAEGCRSAQRNAFQPGTRLPDMGFRVVRGSAALATGGQPDEFGWFVDDLGERHAPVGMSLPGLVMVPIPGGTFMMGSPPGVGSDDEHPQRSVTLAPFLMSTTTVTQAHYEAVIGQNPARFKSDDRPVEHVTWEDAVDFCNALSRKESLQLAYDAQRGLVPHTNGYRLPTETQWEFACRAGNPGRWCFGDDEKKLTEYAWFGEGDDGSTHPVAQKKPNAFGLFDLHGNVWEWCGDWKAPYSSVPQTDPLGASGGDSRVLRGGSFWGDAGGCRSAGRSGRLPGHRSRYLGFRVVRPAPAPQVTALILHHRRANGLPFSPPTPGELTAIVGGPIAEVRLNANLPEGFDFDWQAVAQEMRAQLAASMDRLSSPVHFFGVSLIPFLVDLGAAFGSHFRTIPYHLHHTQRGWAAPPGEGVEVDVLGLPEAHSDDDGPIVFRVSTSYEVHPADTRAVVARSSAEIHLRLADRLGPDAVRSPEATASVAESFRNALDRAVQLRPRARHVDLFLSVSTGIAFELGRMRNPTVHPPFQTWQYVREASPRYRPAVRIG